MKGCIKFKNYNNYRESIKMNSKGLKAKLKGEKNRKKKKREIKKKMRCPDNIKLEKMSHANKNLRIY